MSQQIWTKSAQTNEIITFQNQIVQVCTDLYSTVLIKASTGPSQQCCVHFSSCGHCDIHNQIQHKEINIHLFSSKKHEDNYINQCLNKNKGVGCTRTTCQYSLNILLTLNNRLNTLSRHSLQYFGCNGKTMS